jgi:phage-related holin
LISVEEATKEYGGSALISPIMNGRALLLIKETVQSVLENRFRLGLMIFKQLHRRLQILGIHEKMES